MLDRNHQQKSITHAEEINANMHLATDNHIPKLLGRNHQTNRYNTKEWGMKQKMQIRGHQIKQEPDALDQDLLQLEKFT
jgi:hypothetical protein